MTHATEKTGILITVFSTASAVGKTLISVNTAAELARQGFHVCLVDLDLQFGDVANFLQLHPDQTLYDAQAAADLSRDSYDPQIYVTVYESGETSFSVLTAPRTIPEAYQVSAKRVGTVLDALRHHYDYVVADTKSAFSELNLLAMDKSTIIAAVAIVDFIPTIKNMKIGYDAMKRMGYASNKIRFILNRSNAVTSIELRDVERLLGVSFYHILPNDFKTAVESIHLGVPIVWQDSYGASPLAMSLQELVNKYTNRSHPVQGKPQKNSIFRFFKK